MTADMAVNSGADSAMPTVLMLLLALGVSTLAAYVALDLVRRVSVLRTRARALSLFGAASAMAIGIWSSQVIGIAAAPPAFAFGYHALGTIGVWTAALIVSLASLGVVSGPVPAPGRVGFGAVALGLGAVATHALALAPLGLVPGIDWQPLPLVAAFAGAAAGCTMALVAFFLGGDRAEPRTLGWQTISALVVGVSLVASQQLVLGAAGLAEQTGSLHAERLSSSTLVLLASVGSCAILGVGLLFSVLEARRYPSLRRAEGALRRHDLRDDLTGLANRLTFDGMLTQALEHADGAPQRCAVLYIDLDGFKAINELLGLATGDLVLREVAARLKRFARPEDRVAHLGGDEYLVLVGADSNAEDVAMFAEGLQASIGEPFPMNGTEAALTSSIGIALYPEHGPISSLVGHAEAAMRSAKTAGGAGYAFFEHRMNDGARDQLELLSDLRRALSEGQLRLVYQPKIHAPSGEITGAEALMRWEHPTRGLVGPHQFIPIAERFGLIGPIGNWLIDEACRQAGAWRDQGLQMRVAINLSARQLRHPGLADRIDTALRRHGIRPQLMTCEIAESAAMEDASNAIRMVERLSLLGVNISIDDFGTGYSSLSYLRKLRTGELKIDKSFVVDLETSADARAIVDGIVKLAHAIGLKVVAEGVETEAQHQILRSLGCHELQGFLFARPMSPQALSALAMEDAGPRLLEFRDSLYRTTAAGALH